MREEKKGSQYSVHGHASLSDVNPPTRHFRSRFYLLPAVPQAGNQSFNTHDWGPVIQTTTLDLFPRSFENRRGRLAQDPATSFTPLWVPHLICLYMSVCVLLCVYVCVYACPSICAPCLHRFRGRPVGIRSIGLELQEVMSHQ